MARVLQFILAAAFALAPALSGAAPAVAATRPAPPPAPDTGALIVRLHAAPPHAAPRPGRVQPLAERQARATHARRWQALLADTGLARVPGLRLEPVGGASFRLRPAAPWPADEAARWQAALAARAEVAWAVPDTRETRLDQTLPATGPTQALATDPHRASPARPGAPPPAAAGASPDDPLLDGDAGQWWLQPAGGANTDLPAVRRRGLPGIASAWARATGSTATVVAVLDSGLTDHPDLDPARLLPGYDLVADWDDAARRGAARDGDGRDADPRDPGDGLTQAEIDADPGRYAGCTAGASRWHGTAVTGVLAATTGNGLGVAGIDHAARVLPVRVAGPCGATVRDIVDGLRWAAGLPVCARFADTLDPDAGCTEWAPTNPHPARLVNLSYGGAAPCNAEYQAAIDELWARGVLVVAAAGNGQGAVARPANCARALGVTAVHRDGFKAHYANFGAGLGIATVGGDDAGGRWGPLLADGGLLTLDNGGWQAPGEPGYGLRAGTSYAAPVATGTLALMLALHPALTPQALRDGLAASARPHVQSPLLPACGARAPGRCACGPATCGPGLLDAEQALAYVQALADNRAYAPPAWPAAVIDTPELRQAVALGPDKEAAAGESPAEDAGASTGGGGLPLVTLGLLMLAGLGLRRR